MIRQSVMKRIYDYLQMNKSFRIEDFSVSQAKTPTLMGLVHNDEVSIKYVYNPNYFFEMEFITDGTKVNVRYCPGYSRMEETGQHDTKDLRNCLSEIFSWTERIETEQAAIPWVRKMEEQQLQIQKIEQIVTDIPDQYLTREEAVDLISRLERLEQEMINSISQGREEDNQLKIELLSTTQDIERLKEQVAQLTKKNWIRAFLARSIDWAEAHPKTIGFAFTAVSHFVSSHDLSVIGTSSSPDELIATTGEHDA